jgi:MFS family permease
LGGLAISEIGDWLYGVALVAFVFDETGSAGWVATSRIVALIPYALFGVLGGLIADRFTRNSVMITSDLVRAITMFALALVASFTPSVAAAVALAFICTTAGTPHGPAVAAITPELVDEGRLARANAIISTIENVALSVGPALGGLLLILGSPSLAFMVNGVSFLVSALIFTRIESRSPGSGAGAGASVRGQLVEGLRAVGGSADVASIALILTVPTFFYGMEGVLLVLVSDQLLGTGSEGLGFLYGAAGLGGLVGAAAAGRLAKSPRPGRIMAAALTIIGMSLFGIAFTREPWIAYMLMMLDGIGTIVVEVVGVTLLQRALPRELVARVFGLLDAVAVTILLLGSILAPILVETFSLRTALIVGGLVLPILTASTLRRLLALDTRSQNRLRAIDSVVEILQRTPVLDGVSRPALEAIATATVPYEVRAGETIMRQGDPADDLYIVRSGRLKVASSGDGTGPEVEINTLTDGDHFGEIGLLEGSPRTATVRAMVGCSLLRIPGQAFLDALTRMPSVLETLRMGANTRLARSHHGRTSAGLAGSPRNS